MRIGVPAELEAVRLVWASMAAQAARSARAGRCLRHGAYAGRISRVDPVTGAITTFATGLPKRMPGFPFGGVVDVAFIGSTAYALVTLVGEDVGGADRVGIYRVDGPDRFTLVADIGEFSLQNPPTIPFEYLVPTGAQYALETYRGGFLVTDGHLNRVLQVSRNGDITELIGFGNVVPTGLAVSGSTVYMAWAGPLPHVPADGKVVALDAKSSTLTKVASGAPLLVDVEFGRGHAFTGCPREFSRLASRGLQLCRTRARSWPLTKTGASASLRTV